MSAPGSATTWFVPSPRRPAPSGARGDARPSAAANDGAGTAERAGWALASLALVWEGVQTWAGSLSIPGANVAAIVLVLAGLLALWRSLARGLGRIGQPVVMLALCVGVGSAAATRWVADPAYGTDAAAFDQYAAELVAHGHNPYTHSMAPALRLFHVPAVYSTYRLDGTTVHDLSYPAGSFLPYVPLVRAGLSLQAANIVDLLFWLAACALVFVVLPRHLRWVAALLVPATIYTAFVAGGVTDALFLPFVVGALWRWDRYGDAGAGLARWIGPVCLGLAASIKQTPWFLLPFLVIGVWVEARHHGRRPAATVGRYLATAGGVFAAVNAPFVVADPAAWVRGCVVPLVEPTIADGQGLVNLSLYERLGGGDLSFYSYGAAALLALALVWFAARYRTLKAAWVPLVALVFFFPTRSFASYLTMLVPAAVVGMVTVGRATFDPFPRLTRRAGPLCAALCLLPAACFAVALSTPAPLTVHVVRTGSTGQRQTLDEITVHVRNRTGHRVRPHFTVNSGAHVTTFWYGYHDGRESSVTVPAHGSATVTLHAPNTASQPSLSTPLVVEAFATGPGSVSTSHRFLVSPLSTSIEPEAVDRPVPVGRPTVLRVQLVDRYGSAVRRRGVAVTLGQVVYAQNALMPGESSINGAPEGKSPVVARTDARGSATFTVVGLQVQGAPIYYQAWISGRGVPHGYSNTVLMRYEVPR